MLPNGSRMKVLPSPPQRSPPVEVILPYKKGCFHVLLEVRTQYSCSKSPLTSLTLLISRSMPIALGVQVIDGPSPLSIGHGLSELVHHPVLSRYLVFTMGEGPRTLPLSP